MISLFTNTKSGYNVSPLKVMHGGKYYMQLFFCLSSQVVIKYAVNC